MSCQITCSVAPSERCALSLKAEDVLQTISANPYPNRDTGTRMLLRLDQDHGSDCQTVVYREG